MTHISKSLFQRALMCSSGVLRSVLFYYTLFIFLRRLDVHLWYINLSAFQYSTLIVFCKRALTSHTAMELPLFFAFLCSTMFTILQSLYPFLYSSHFSSFQFATLFAFCQRALTCRYRALTFECWYPTAVQILWQSALAQSCRPSFVFILHKPKSTSDVFCRLGDNSNISFTLEKKDVQ